jgi:RimJ/RimL family protein N-acetyltransferase
LLDIANKYEKELQELFMNTWYDEKYKYYHSQYADLYQANNSNWDDHHFVSKDNSGNIIGFISYTIDRQCNFVSNIGAVNFSDNKITFGKDLMTAIAGMFDKFNFNKINFGVTVGNPIERSYDRLVQKYGGRVLGIYKDNRRLIDNQLYDSKVYEIMRSDYIKAKEQKSGRD